MLNHIWLALIIIGILTAAGRDVFEVVNNSYGNGIPWEIHTDDLVRDEDGGSLQFTLRLPAEELRRHFPTDVTAGDVRIPVKFFPRGADNASLVLNVTGEDVPERLTVMAEALGSEETLTGQLVREGDGWRMRFDEVSLVYLRKVTNAAFEIAGVAVQIALGLIGIMALWLGVMRVAEQAGLIAHLARLVRPITVRLLSLIHI